MPPGNENSAHPGWRALAKSALFLVIALLAMAGESSHAAPRKACPSGYASLGKTSAELAWVRPALKRNAWEFGGDHKDVGAAPGEVAKAIRQLDFGTAPILASASRERLELIARDAKYARSVHQAVSKEFKAIDSVALSDYAPEALQTDARIILERMHLNKERVRQGAALTPQQFEEQARIAGLETKNFPVVYRYDQRTPRDIFEEGFQPNPNMPVRTLIEHVMPSSNGSGSFVSTTSKSGNLLKIIQPNSLLAWDEAIMLDSAKGKLLERIKGEEKFFYFDHNEADFKKLSLPRAQQNFRETPEVFRTFEYQVGNVRGVAPGQYGIESEAEVAVAKVRREQVEKFREVLLVDFGSVNGRRVYGIQYGDWRAGGR